MGTVEVIKKFIESNRVLEKTMREVLERLPTRFRYGISYGSNFRYWLAFLKESQNWDRERIIAYQIEQLKDLLTHAGKNVPYYRKVFKDYGFRPEELQGTDDLKRLPFIERRTIREKSHELIAENIPKRRLISTNTSGTTGIPLTVYGTKETEEKHWATIIDLWSRVGYSPASRTVLFEGNIREGNQDNLPLKRYANKLILSSNYFTTEWLEKYRELINDFNPQFMIGFPHTIATFSSYVRIGKKTFCEGLKGVILYAENVYGWQRGLIEDALGTRVFSDYGMVEKVAHGGECEFSQAYHLYPQYGLTEYININDARYELVATGFVNYAMPLIRYRTGDLGIKGGERCSMCERSHELLDNIEGRTGDFLITSDGEIISVHLTGDFHIFRNIDRFQLYQETPGKVELRIVAKDSYTKNTDAENILSVIKHNLGLLGENIRFSTVVVSSNEDGFPKKYRMIDQQLDIKEFLT